MLLCVCFAFCCWCDLCYYCVAEVFVAVKPLDAAWLEYIARERLYRAPLLAELLLLCLKQTSSALSLILFLGPLLFSMMNCVAACPATCMIMVSAAAWMVVVVRGRWSLSLSFVFASTSFQAHTAPHHQATKPAHTAVCTCYAAVYSKQHTSKQ